MTRREALEVVSFDDLRSLAAARAPCITAGIAIPDPLQLHARIQNLIRGIERHLKDAGVNSEEEFTLVQPIRTLANAIEEEHDWSIGLILYRSPDLFRHFWLRDTIEDFVTVSQTFQIRPLLSVVSKEQKFYVLALSQKHTRLLTYTYQSHQELQLRGLAPQSLRVWMNTRVPDHVLDNWSAGGPSVGKMKGVVFGTNSDRERHEEYLKHFFKEIDKGVHHILLGHNALLILAGVEEEVAVYRHVNSYPRLIEQAVLGSPDALEPNELHDRAMEIAREIPPPPLQRALDQLKEVFGTKLALSNMDEIVQRADEGRVADLLLGEESGPQADLLNLAVLKTLQHRGQAFTVKKSKLPPETDAVAILRY
jgi:Bacterial archaeo-eukaryotic release factor family 3